MCTTWKECGQIMSISGEGSMLNTGKGLNSLASPNVVSPVGFAGLAAQLSIHGSR